MKGKAMSKHEFRVRYIFSPNMRTVRLCCALFMVSGSALVASATIPGAETATDAAKAVGGLTAQELLALVTLAALALAVFCLKAVFKQGESATRALTEIADKMRDMKCVRELGKNA